MIDISFKNFKLERPGEPSDVLLAIDALKLKNGRSYGIVGQSGCGKSLFLRAVAGLHPHHGSVALRWSTGRPLKRGEHVIQFVPQNPYQAFHPGWSIQRTLERIPQSVRIEGFSDIMHEFCETLELSTEMLDRTPTALSGGQLQRLSVLRAMLANPALLILDEPTSALDADYIHRLKTLLDRHRAYRPFTLLVSEHNEAVLAYLGAQIYRLEAGELYESTSF